MYLKIEWLNQDLQVGRTSIFEGKSMSFGTGRGEDGSVSSFHVTIDDKEMLFDMTPNQRATFYIMNNDGKTIDRMNWMP